MLQKFPQYFDACQRSLAIRERPPGYTRAMLTFLLIAVNVIVSLIGFSKMNSSTEGRMFFFSPSEVSAGRNYEGMFLSHFSHADPGHLIFNMLTLYFFGPTVEEGLGAFGMLAVYIVAGIFSTLVVYYRHRRQPGYRALGASDSISGILFAAIVLVPGMRIAFMFVPVPIPAPLFAIGYILLSTFFMRRGRGNIGHEAHLAGAFTGLILAGLLSPEGYGPLFDTIRSYFS
jgi:membrane associated rhomboid family serine protease